MLSIELSVNAVKGSNMEINEIIKQLGIDLNCLSYAYYDDVVYDKIELIGSTNIYGNQIDISGNSTSITRLTTTIKQCF